MAYRRSSRIARRPRRRAVRRRTTRTTRRTRPYRARRPRRMTRRNILELTSTKKQDTMLCTNPLGAPGPYPQAGVNASAGSFIFCPTYRPKATDVTGETENSASARFSSTCYVKGIRERWSISSVGGSPIRWRRIVFHTASTLTSVVPAGKYQGTLPGNIRIRPFQNLTTTELNDLMTQVAQGVKGTDYLDWPDFKCDVNKIKVISDKTSIIRPETSAGTSRTVNIYTPIEKYIRYLDNEFAEDEVSSPYCTPSGSPLGNVFIWDIFQATLTTSPETNISVAVNTTHYWHER